jgi:translocation and assembly module TamA
MQPFHKTFILLSMKAPPGARAICASHPPGYLLYFTLLLCVLCGWSLIPTASYGAEPVEIVVEGVEGDARRNVLEALVLPYGLVKEGATDRLWLERFVRQAEGKVINALEPFGYYSARVTTSIETSAANQYRVMVDVETGPPVILKDIQVSVTGPGASETPLAGLAANFPLKPGNVLLHQTYEQAKRNLQARAQELGYLDAQYSTHEIHVDPAVLAARIHLILETGERYAFAEVAIEGAPDYPDAFLRRYIPFDPGDVFSYARLAEFQIQLNNSERFRDVVVEAEKEQAQEFKIPVRVFLKQTPRKSLRPGIGYGTDTGARFSLRYRDLNLFHRGHEFHSNLFVSEHLQGLATGYIIPGHKDIRTFTSAQINIQQENVTTYKNRLLFLELAHNRSLGDRRQGTAYIRFQHEEFTIGVQDSSSRYVLPGLLFSGNYYDSPVRPGRGFRYAFDLRGTHRSLGSTTELLQLITEASHILSLPWRLTLHSRTRGGLTFFSDPVYEIPPSLRFFAGGDQSVRGWAYQSLGPRDASGRVVGGKHLLTGGVDLQRALFERWAVSVFYNAGNAFDSFSDLTLYQAAGIGVHYYLPVGALNLYVARQLNVEDPGYRVHLTVGFEF